MASFSYNFTVYCKASKQSDIDAFRSRIKKAIEDGDLEPTDFNLDCSPSSMSFYFENSNVAYDKHLRPFVKEFSSLSFFFALEQGDNSNNNNLNCGYAVFDGGVLGKSETWLAKLKENEDDFNEAREDQIAECEKTFSKKVKNGALAEWLSKDKNSETAHKEQTMPGSMKERDYDDGMAYITVFSKGISSSIMRDFIRDFEAEADEDDDNKTYKDYGWKITEKTDTKLELEGPSSAWDIVKELADRTSCNFPIFELHTLRVAIFTDIEEDGQCGYSYLEIKHSIPTSLKGAEWFALGDYDDDENDTLTARATALTDIIFPLTEKWLEEEQR